RDAANTSTAQQGTNPSNNDSSKPSTDDSKPSTDGNTGSAGSTGNANGNTASMGSAASTLAVADGSIAPNGFAVFVLDPKGAVPVTLRTLASNVTDAVDGGFSLNGTVMIDAPGNAHITLAEAKLSLAYDAKKGEGLQSFQ